jgi:hypothetical protein
MKQAIFTFLIALMIMPSLACAMPVCADDTPAEVSSAQPCAGHHSENNQTDSSSDRQKFCAFTLLSADHFYMRNQNNEIQTYYAIRAFAHSVAYTGEGWRI